MEIEKLRRLWYLSTVPTHSRESVTELHELVREAAVHNIPKDVISPCNVCVNKDVCIDNGDIARECICSKPVGFINFELRMSDNEQ